MRNGEVIQIVEDAINKGEEKGDVLLELMTKSPAYGQTYIEIKGMEIQKILLNIQLITLCYARALSIYKDKENKK